MAELRPEVRAFFADKKLSSSMFLDGVAPRIGRWGGSIASSPDVPRLVRKQVYWFKTRRVVTAWFVDGERVPDLNAAYDLLTEKP